MPNRVSCFPRTVPLVQNTLDKRRPWTVLITVWGQPLTHSIWTQRLIPMTPPNLDPSTPKPHLRVPNLRSPNSHSHRTKHSHSAPRLGIPISSRTLRPQHATSQTRI